MTTKERFKQFLIDRGMFDSQADEVIEIFIKQVDYLNGSYQITWDRPSTEYPDAFYAVHIGALKEVALSWINENIPLAWFKDLFL